MDEDIRNLIVYGTLGIIIFIGSIVLGSQWWTLNISEPFPVKCWIDDKLIYEGKAACISTHSEGANTSVQIDGGFMCFFPNKFYVAKNVRLEGER